QHGEPVPQAEPGGCGTQALTPPGGGPDHVAQLQDLRVGAVQVDIPDHGIVHSGGKSVQGLRRGGDQSVPELHQLTLRQTLPPAGGPAEVGVLSPRGERGRIGRLHRPQPQHVLLAQRAVVHRDQPRVGMVPVRRSSARATAAQAKKEGHSAIRSTRPPHCTSSRTSMSRPTAVLTTPAASSTHQEADQPRASAHPPSTIATTESTIPGADTSACSSSARSNGVSPLPTEEAPATTQHTTAAVTRRPWGSCGRSSTAATAIAAPNSTNERFTTRCAGEHTGTC